MISLIVTLIVVFGVGAYLKTVPKQKVNRGFDRLIKDIGDEK